MTRSVKVELFCLYILTLGFGNAISLPEAVILHKTLDPRGCRDFDMWAWQSYFLTGAGMAIRLSDLVANAVNSYGSQHVHSWLNRCPFSMGWNGTAALRHHPYCTQLDYHVCFEIPEPILYGVKSLHKRVQSFWGYIHCLGILFCWVTRMEFNWENMAYADELNLVYSTTLALN